MIRWRVNAYDLMAPLADGDLPLEMVNILQLGGIDGKATTLPGVHYQILSQIEKNGLSKQLQV